MKHGWLAGTVTVVGMWVIGSALAVAAPVRAVSPPARVRLALLMTDHARYVVLREVSQSGLVEYEIDSVDGRAATLTDGRVSSIQIRTEVYTPGSDTGCFVAAKRSGGLLPNVAGMLLPSGVAALRYRLDGRKLGWRISTGGGGYQPHGVVAVDLAGRIVSATVHSGPGAPLRATASYPATAPRITAPKRVCVASETNHGRRDQ
jgi:hypothetical protein